MAHSALDTSSLRNLLEDLLPDSFPLEEEFVLMANRYLFSGKDYPVCSADPEWRDTLTYLRNIITRNRIATLHHLIEYYSIKEDRMALFLTANVVIEYKITVPFLPPAPFREEFDDRGCLDDRERGFLNHSFSPDQLDINEEDSRNIVCLR